MVAFVDHGFGVEAFDPGEGRGVGETEVVGEEEDKSFVVGLGLKKEGVFFGSVFDVVVGGWLVVTFE